MNKVAQKHGVHSKSSEVTQVSKRKTDAIYSELLDRICLLEYPPKTMLREGDLAEEFGTSRTPIREVLLRLALLGLVESRTGVGTFVTDIAYEKYLDLCEIRLKITELIGELSPNDASDEDVEAVEQILVRARKQQKSFDLKTYWLLNHDLHFVVRRLIGNSELRELWDRYYYQTSRLFYSVASRDTQTTSDAFAAEVDATLRAMRENDIKGVGHIQRCFIAMGMRRVKAALQPVSDDRGVGERSTLTSLRNLEAE